MKYLTILNLSLCLFFHESQSLSVTPTTMSADGAGSKRGPVIVTGGSRGIGKSTCLLLASKGYDVVINCRKEIDAASALCDEIENNRKVDKHVGKAFVVQADVSKEDQVTRMFDQVETFFGMPPSGLVNNAGILGKKTNDISQLSSQDLDEIFATNVHGPFNCCKEFMKRTSSKTGGKGGSIVNVSSGSAYIGYPLVYAMSKAALDSMTTGLIAPAAEQGIRINTVAPGVTETDMVSSEKIEATIPNIPMKRAGKPSEIAESIVFLLSDASSYTSGAKIRISGGRP
mmetsp:Transcript_10300/g.14553  ORF Transcript_10300/g.14553 Transcript_10300/m.14553 type:complete len:286 (+) Transcript_10300:87-944(+)